MQRKMYLMGKYSIRSIAALIQNLKLHTLFEVLHFLCDILSYFSRIFVIRPEFEMEVSDVVFSLSTTECFPVLCS